jgi:hypothetical protein
MAYTRQDNLDVKDKARSQGRIIHEELYAANAFRTLLSELHPQASTRRASQKKSLSEQLQQFAISTWHPYNFGKIRKNSFQ